MPLAHTCYHAECGRSSLNDVQENPENRGAFELLSLGIGAVADPRYTPVHICYLAERGRSALKDVVIIQRTPYIENPENCGALGPAPLGWGCLVMSSS